GDRVVYLSGGGSGISLVKFGSSPGVTLFEGGIDTRPSFSKDGRQVVFGSNRGGAWDLITVGVSSGRTRKLTDTFERETDPDWRSPPGHNAMNTRVRAHSRIQVL